MRALMQDWSLTLDKIFDHAARWHGEREVVTRSVEGPITRSTYADLHRRAKQVSHALLEAGVKPGDRVATMGWNSDRHLEAWYGTIGIGAILHTLNPRLFPEQIVYIANHAGDEVLLADPACAPLLAEILPQCPGIRQVVFLSEEAPETPFPAQAYEAWIAGRPTDTPWGGFDENDAAGLCYTSGTTGNPKGVLYGHRSNYLHAMMTLQPDALNLSARDTVMLIVPMYHANAWGVMYSAPMVGAKLVLPGQKLDGASLHELIETEGVTYSAGVPTIWQMLLTHLKETGGKLTTLQRVTVGGSACPESIFRTLHDDYGVDVIHGWGMTETSPLATVSVPSPEIADLGFEAQLPYKLKQGRLLCNLDLKLVNDAGERLPHDGKTFGRLLIKGPTIASGYFRAEGGEVLDDEGFFDTGDVSTIDPEGYMQITDRAKDVIKSGGEWISSIDIENIAVGADGVACAAVIGIAHPKWDERPLLIIEPKPGAAPTREQLLTYLEGKIAKWWMPDDVAFVEKIPLGATGKINKLALRETFKDYKLPSAQAAE
ncbi:MAG: long-chain-fatty-acid--CoA ligase [Phenylobacterium sp.]|uniref:long-chain-fatty-acid--CoA ligase n=1 Tax=Phenylobacterium sp. TaxID=1871053 RepID=UPI0025D9BEC8|nr:long-chain-fatty-acid--CoA ligase [Phenylobacterium sp.]MBI1196818.1 long-chain-fatty-acid--CoA ligase [Phenylobacterium sp.]